MRPLSHVQQIAKSHPLGHPCNWTTTANYIKSTTLQTLHGSHDRNRTQALPPCGASLEAPWVSFRVQTTAGAAYAGASSANTGAGKVNRWTFRCMGTKWVQVGFVSY